MICQRGDCRHLAGAVAQIAQQLRNLLRCCAIQSSFLDRLEEVGIVTEDKTRSYGLVGPIARASGVARDIRKLFPYAAYASINSTFPSSKRATAMPACAFCSPRRTSRLPSSAVCCRHCLRDLPAPTKFGCARGPRLWQWRRRSARRSTGCGSDEDGKVVRYRVTPPSFTNWHGFHLAAENFAFQDFPIILASFGLSNAECDR